MTLIDTARRTEIRLELDRALRVERAAFAAKVRVTRAILDMSQQDFAGEVGLTQRSVHRIEQGAVEPKLRTVHAIEQFWHRKGISFEDLRDGGFRLDIASPTLLNSGH